MNIGLLRIAALIFVPLALIAAIVMYLIHRAELNADFATWSANEARVVELGRQRVAITLTGAYSDLMYLSDQAALKEWLAAPPATHDADVLETKLIEEYLAFARHKGNYDRIRFYNVEGDEEIRVEWTPHDVTSVPRSRLNSGKVEPDIQKGLRLERGQIMVSPLELHSDDGKVAQPLMPKIRVTAAVFDQTGERRGAIVVDYMAKRMIERIKGVKHSGTSDIWLVNSDGYWLLGTNAEDEWGFAFQGRAESTVGNRFPEIWQQMQMKQGSHQIHTSEGLFTFATVRPSVELNGDYAAVPVIAVVDAPLWYLVSYVSQQQIDAHTSTTGANFLVGYGAILMLLIALSLGLATLASRLRASREELVATASFFRAAAEGGLSAFFVFNAERDTRGGLRALRLAYLNPLAERMVEGKAAVVAHKSVETLMRRIRGAEDGDMAMYRSAFERNEVSEREYRITAGPFSGRHFEEQIVPLPTGIAVSCRDITERKQIEMMKSEFVSTVSHELRTPLTAIRGSLGLIVGGIGSSLSEDVRNLLDIAYKNCERLVRLINDILDIEKIESGRMPFHIRPLALMPFLRQSLEANAAFAEKYGIHLLLDPSCEADDHETLTVMADSDRLMQVMTNLLSNAVKFSPRGETVTVKCQAGSDRMRISVIDRGPGIPDSFRSRIFQKFAQAGGAADRDKGGTGLGLSIVRAIMEEMHGAVELESGVGAGATFSIDLPKAASHASAPATHRQKPAADERRILICEDEVDIANLLRIILERASFATDIVCDAESAMKALHQRPYAAMTLDLILPDKCGITMIRDIRQDPALARLPVIVVSAKAESGKELLRGDAIGIMDWMVKPIDAGRLLTTVENLRRTDRSARILHVEDDGGIAEIIRQTLAKLAVVTSVPSLAAAREMLAAHEYDLVILDVGLPDGSGLDLLPLLGSGRRYPIPVVLFTATEVPTEVSAQVEAMMIKSKTSDEKLLETIRHLVEMAPPGE